MHKVIGLALAGVVVLRIPTFMAVVEDLCVGLAAIGFRRIVFLNGHYDNTYAIAYACANVADRLPAGTKAFYLYAETDNFADFTVTATAQDGTTSGPVTVKLADSTIPTNTTITGYGGTVTLIGIDTANLDATGNALTVAGTARNDTITYTPTGAAAGTPSR